MLMTGLMIFLGVVLILAKLPRRLMLRALHHDVALDLLVSVLVLIIHWGTFSGVMAATVAGLMTSLATSGAKRLFGHIRDNRYHPGLFYLDVDESSLRSTSR
jgi:nucleoside permease NupC